MVKVLFERKRGNVVWFYLREQFYEGVTVKEKYLGPATLKDVSDVLKPSLISSRRILQIVGALVGIGNLLILHSDLSEGRRHDYDFNINNGMWWSAGLAVLHARVNGLSSSDTINKLYLDALRLTISDFKIEKNRAFGLSLTDDAVNETLKSVSVDAKNRVVIPKIARMLLNWKPGDDLQPRINLENGEIIFHLVKSSQVPQVPARLCESFLEISEGFFDICMRINPITADELRKAINKDVSLSSILFKDTPDISNLLRKILVGKEDLTSLHNLIRVIKKES